MSWLIFIAALEAGYLPSLAVTDYTTGPIPREIQGLWYTDLSGEIRADRVFLAGGVHTQMYPSGGGFFPTVVRFDFSAGVRFGPVEAGYRHSCTHPMYPWLPYASALGRDYRPQYEGAYDQVYIRVTTGTKTK
jgi:hypothetical protein